jgi:phosphoglycolate phosphatase
MQSISILFDLDGTLIDPHRGITESARYAMQKMARPLPPHTNLNWFIGPPIQQNFARLLHTEDQALIDTAVAHYRTRYSTTGLFEAIVYEGVPEMLAALQAQGFRLLLATSKPKEYAQEILVHFGLVRYFAAVYGSQLDGRLADKTDLIRHILASEQLNPAQTVMVGDREHDILGATANGVAAVAALYGYGRAPDLHAAGHHWPIYTPLELLNVLKTITHQQKE